MSTHISKVLLLASIAAIGITGLPSKAAAQLEEIVVTAERRTENLQEVPISITAFSADQLEQLQIYEAEDLLRRLPNLTGANNVGQSSNVGYFLRGVGNDESLLSFDPPVQTYVDDVLMPRQINNNVSFLDAERVEVLRGPQGQLHGRNTTGGAVKFFTKKPSDDFNLRLSGKVGNYDEIYLFGTINGGIADGIYGKLTGFWEDDEGFQDNVVTGQSAANKDRWGLRGQLRFEPSEKVMIDVALDYSEIDEVGAIGGAWPSDGTPPVGPHADSSIDPNLISTPAQAAYADFGTQGDEWGGYVTINWDSGPVVVQSITSYRDGSFFLRNEFVDPSAPGTDILASLGIPGLITPPVDQIAAAFPLGIFIIEQNSSIETFTQELKGNSNFTLWGKNTEWVGGLYYLRERNSQVGSDFFNAFGLNTANRTFEFDIDSYALYSQFDYYFTEALSLQLGFRVTREEKSADVLYCLPVCGVAPSFSNADIIAAGTAEMELDNTEFDPKVGLKWQVNPDLMAYASIAKSHKPGGWNLRVDTFNDFNNYQPEEAWSYEVGSKIESFNNKLRTNVAVFYVDYLDIVTTAATGAGGGGASVFSLFNAGDANVYGVELELLAIPIEGLDVFTTVGYQEGDIDPAPGVTITSTEIKQKPDWNVNLGAQYRRQFTNRGYVFFGADLSWHDDYFAIQSSDIPLIKSRTVVGANLGWETNEGRFKAVLECTNCFDETNIQWNLFNRFYPNYPRRYGLRVFFNFD